MAKLKNIECIYTIILDEIEVPDAWVKLPKGIIRRKYDYEFYRLVKAKANKIVTRTFMMDFDIVDYDIVEED